MVSIAERAQAIEQGIFDSNIVVSIAIAWSAVAISSRTIESMVGLKIAITRDER